MRREINSYNRNYIVKVLKKEGEYVEASRFRKSNISNRLV